jgi:DNA-binding transcriptional MerR regulator
MKKTDRRTKALLAIHDLCSRQDTTARKVKNLMLKEGFTLEEIKTAVDDYMGKSK